MSGDAGSWLGVIALAIPAATIAATIPRGLWRMDLRRRTQTSAAQAMAADRAALLSRVRDKWIDGVLEPSLAHTERLALDQPPVLQVFLRSGGGLLIRGAPGGGKTTVLLELADGLLERAGSDPSQPVPVVASLASWTGRRQQLDAWLTDELAASYRIPQATARDWAAQNDLVLLLDGLDEVDERYRDSCAEAINQFLRDRPIARVAVCCRTETARSLGTELALPQTVELRPVARSQVDSYLARLETTWTPLADIRAALAADEDLRVPLMLKIAALANRGRPLPARQPDRVPRWLRAPEWPQEIAEIFAPVPPETVRQAPLDRATMWEAYVARMLEHRSLNPGREYDATTARRSLAWLAAHLRDSGQAEFQLDQLAAAGPTRPAGAAHRRLRQAALWTDRYVHTTALDLARSLEPRASEDQARFRIAMANWLRDHVAQARPGGWVRHLPQAMIRPAAEVGWSPDRLPSLTPPVTALIVLPATTAIAAVIAGWPLALAVALGEGLLWGLNLPDRLGLKPRARRHRTVPNESIRRSARHATMIGLATAACFGTGLGLVSIVMGGLGAPAIVAAALLAGAGASVSNGAGACAHHYIARLRLARDGVIPWRYQRFLDAMAERMLLHRSGSGYLFIHRLLADHLANNHTNPANMIENTTPGLANTEPIPVALAHEQAYRADQPPSERVSHRAQQPAGRHSAGTG
jgi:predicted ATPase